MKIRQNIDWAHLSFLSCTKADGHTWREREREHMAGQSLCYGLRRTSSKMSWCFTGRHGRGKCCGPSTVVCLEIWRMMRRLCVVARWWKCDLIGDSELVRAAVGCSLGLLGFFGTLFLLCLLNTKQWKCFSTGANHCYLLVQWEGNLETLKAHGCI